MWEGSKIKKMHLFFSHKLTSNQETDARNNLGITSFVELPKDLKKKWLNIPPEPSSIKEFLVAFFDYIDEKVSPHDYVLIQGEYGAVFSLVNYCLDKSLKPVYSTTERKVIVEKKEGTITKTSQFEHVKFRKYEVIKNE